MCLLKNLLLLSSLRLVFLLELLVVSQLFLQLCELSLKRGLLLDLGFLVGVDLAGGDKLIKGDIRVCRDDLLDFGNGVLGSSSAEVDIRLKSRHNLPTSCSHCGRSCYVYR